MIVTKEHVLNAMRCLFGSDDPQQQDLSDREWSFFTSYLRPILDEDVEYEIMDEVLDELVPHQEDDAWVTSVVIRERLSHIISKSGLSKDGLHERPDAIATAFGAYYRSGPVRIVEDHDSKNDTFIIFTSWRDVSFVTREYNRRYNYPRFRIWDPHFLRVSKESNGREDPWYDFTFGIDEKGNLVHRDKASTWTNPWGKKVKNTFKPNSLIGISDICEFGFNDEYDTCKRCSALIRTSPDSYSWQPDFHFFEGEGNICHDCIRGNDELEAWYVEDHTNTNRLINLYVVDPTDKLGWVELEELDYENGLHPGQRDDPEAIIEALNEHGIDCIFRGWVGQFDVNWRVIVPESKESQAIEILEGSNTKLPYDPGTEMGKALRGEGSDHVKVRKLEIRNNEVAIDEDWKGK